VIKKISRRHTNNGGCVSEISARIKDLSCEDRKIDQIEQEEMPDQDDGCQGMQPDRDKLIKI
jgi:hypothetical protein